MSPYMKYLPTVVKGISHGKKSRCQFNAGLVYRDNHGLLRPYCLGLLPAVDHGGISRSAENLSMV